MIMENGYYYKNSKDDRFYMKWNDFLKGNDFFENENYLDDYSVVDKLNELYEENQKLKKENGVLEKRVEIYKRDGLETINNLIKTKKQCDEFYKENQQLKLDCEDLEEELCYCRKRLKGDEVHEELRKENEKLMEEMGELGKTHAEEIGRIEDDFIEEIVQLEKENEQLKKDVEYYKIERKVLFAYFDNKDNLKLELKLDDYDVSKNKKSEPKEQSCGFCKHFQFDGMFGAWCDINDTDYLKYHGNCPNYEGVWK